MVFASTLKNAIVTDAKNVAAMKNSRNASVHAKLLASIVSLRNAPNHVSIMDANASQDSSGISTVIAFQKTCAKTKNIVARISIIQMIRTCQP